ncbi:DUF2062 domain-containing protein [Pseudaquabacterium pictum]|uniref:DUF2062 domain-containing protein n=1 Tax=Pseudaquabacterium pictum TaxID=2315236 RepID=A0A480AQR3_9BURK|nr:DUF2062 domain-containing protein [Rubrivivax pictus]GCL63276.1 hypothetical protein AQPW35_23570 [Rubrivivax pictus]
MPWTAIKARLRRLLPEPDTLAQNRWLRWLGPALHHPRLWHMSRRGIALGAAIGVFFGFLIPLAQIPVSAAFAVALRANVPTAVASTLVTNPITFPPVYYAAWKVGGAILGEAGPAPGRAQAEPPPAEASGNWLQRTWASLQRVGKPLVLGLAIFACGFGLLVYLLVHLGWRAQVRFKRWRRTRAAAR